MVCTSSWTITRDHLRVCGADVCIDGYQYAYGGSSPRVRSRLDHPAQ